MNSRHVSRSFAPRLAAALLPALTLTLLTAGAAGAALNPQRVIYQKDSLYHRIFVFQDGDIVTLRFGRRDGPLTQSQISLSEPSRHLLEYSQLMFCGLLHCPAPRRALILGLGGGMIPREMRRYFPEAEIDVAEIDPEVAEVARRFFDFKTDARLNVHVSDGRMFIRRQLRRQPAPKYDIVLLDAFNSDYIPFHLMTKEFLEEVRGVLADDGVVVANVFYTNALFDAELATFLAVFGRTQAYYGATSVNAMLVAPGPRGQVLKPDEAAAIARALQEKHRFSFDLEAVARRLRPDVRPAPGTKILTDDRAPVNWLKEQKSNLPAP